MKIFRHIPIIFVVILLSILVFACSGKNQEKPDDKVLFQCTIQENIENAQTIGDILIGRFEVTAGYESDHLGYLNPYPGGEYCFSKDLRIGTSTIKNWESTFGFIINTRGEYKVLLNDELSLGTKINEWNPDNHVFGGIFIVFGEGKPFGLGISSQYQEVSLYPWWSIVEPWNISKPFSNP